MSNARHEFRAGEIVDLLSELDNRLKARGISAAIFVVGGAAIAVTSNDDPRRTEDIDAITRDEAVLEEARAMASQRKLPEDWLNTRASSWMPPLPEDALQHDDAPGLHITYATDEFLLATKLIAQRRKDAADIVLLAERLNLKDPSVADLEQLICRHYTDRDALEFILDGNDTDRELHLLAVRAERLLANHQSAPSQPPTHASERSDVRRTDRPTSHERS